jgi:diguanylate cyclase (GGDEF)-like protein
MHRDMKDSSWLIRDGLDRQRMLDMERRLQRTRPVAGAIMVLSLLALGPWYGWWLPGPLLLALAMYRVVDARLPRLRRPEFALYGSWIGIVLLVVATFFISNAPAPLLAWATFPVTPLIARFSMRGVVLGLAIMLVTLAAVVVAAHGGSVSPPAVIAPAGAMLAVGVYSLALMQSDAEHRSNSVTDKLTGLLNRTALETRVAELAHQARFTGEPVGVIVCDVDRFKIINDEYGHNTGDAVLENVACVLRSNLRTFDLAYRLGGEEFVVLAPGADLGHCTYLAERLHTAVGTDESGPVGITMSFGVSASVPGSPFEYDRVFAEADRALYTAKRSGRDRVCVCGSAAPAAQAEGAASAVS